MSKFVINRDLFGCYAWLPIWDRSGTTKIDTYVFKIINMHESNGWVDAKNIYWDTESKLHDCNDGLEIVLDVIQCGVSEKKVITVALKDAERLEDGNHNEISKEKLLRGEVYK